MIETLLYLLFLLVGFILGRIGVKSTKDSINTPQPIKMPNLNPISAIKRYEENKEQSILEKEMRINLENINNYDGSSYGQKDI